MKDTLYLGSPKQSPNPNFKPSSLARTLALPMLTAFGSKALEFRAFLINCPSAGKSVRRDAVFKEAFFIELRIETFYDI